MCSEQGRFKDRRDTNCRRYHLCSAGNGGKWVRSSYDCPEGTVFDGSLGHCSLGPCEKDSSSSESSSSSSESHYDGDDYNCKKIGRFDDTKDPYCSGYYECKKHHKGFLFGVKIPCPPPSKFNPDDKQCSHQYVCRRHFECTREGRFDDGTDDNNKRYFLCSKNKKGQYVKSVYTCPLYSRFVSDFELCAIPNETASDEIEIHDHNLPVEDWDNLDSFKCRSRGFNANRYDSTYRSFYFCDVMSDGKFAKYILLCPRYYYWNGDTNLCTPGRRSS